MIKLAELHGQSIDVEALIVGRTTTLSGVGNYEQDATLGAVLRIRFGEDAGGMEILLQESLWRGFVDRPAADKPFVIRLDALTPTGTLNGVAS